MALLHSEYKDRLTHWQRVLAQDFYRPMGEIALEGFTTMEHLTPEQAAQGSFAPIPEGMYWGHTWEYMWCRSRVVLPVEALIPCNLMEENPDEPLAPGADLHLRPFEVSTYRIKLKQS